MSGQPAPSALNPANAVTLLRLVLVPVFAVFLIDGQLVAAFWAFVAASLSDLLDGWLARRYGWVTALGVFIDPLADKALQLTAFTLFAAKGHAPVWMAVLAWARELVVVTGFTLLALVAHIRTVRSSWFGKLTTLLQMTAVSAVLGAAAFAWDPMVEGRIGLVLGLAVLLNFGSGLEYAVKGFQAYEATQGGRDRRA